MENTDADKIRSYSERKGLRDPTRIADNIKYILGGRRPTVAEVKAALANTKLTESIPTSKPLKVGFNAINLQHLRISDKKPNEGLKARLYGLKKGQGYPVEALATEWIVSEDTIRTQAKRLDCLRFVEVSPGEWVQCVLNPDTATEISKR